MPVIDVNRRASFVPVSRSWCIRSRPAPNGFTSYRLIARCENGVVYLWSRTGRNWAGDFPLIGAAMARLPVESVQWGECATLLERSGLELPTEAQWEYACRGGTQTP